jgi:hypothetical protein
VLEGSRARRGERGEGSEGMGDSKEAKEANDTKEDEEEESRRCMDDWGQSSLRQGHGGTGARGHGRCTDA